MTADEVRLVEAHLAVCDACASTYRFERRVVIELKRKLQRIDLPAGLADRIRARLADPPEGNGVA